MIPRWMHKWYAKTFGYFWLPCPLCGRYSGGHEWDGTYLPISDFEGVGICPTCARLGAGVRR
jgi:hypothetical protein